MPEPEKPNVPLCTITIDPMPEGMKMPPPGAGGWRRRPLTSSWRTRAERSEPSRWRYEVPEEFAG
jgi:hypothetical protein